MASSSNEESLLAPCLRRLSNQLRVDFAAEVYGAEGKRKREPTRSVYEEAAMEMEKDMKERALKRVAKKTGEMQKKKYTTPIHANTEDNDAYNIIKMMNAATSLAQLRVRNPNDASPVNIGESHKASITEKTIETITKAHEDTLAAKDYIIKSITEALAAKEELIRTQSTLIAMMQQCSANRDRN